MPWTPEVLTFSQKEQQRWHKNLVASEQAFATSGTIPNGRRLTKKEIAQEYTPEKITRLLLAASRSARSVFSQWGSPL